MTNFTLGRIGFSEQLDDVVEFAHNGSRVTAAWETWLGVDEATAIRQQLLGYVDNADEPVVPVTWSDDSDVNGYYRVLDASVTPDEDMGLDGLYMCVASLERVQTYGAPLLEATALMATRPGTHGQVSGVSLIGTGVPAASRHFLEFDPDMGSYFGGLGELRHGEGDRDALLYEGTARIRQFYVDPLHHYDAAATVRLRGADGVYRAAVGRQIPNAVADWQVSNDLFRITPQFSGGLFQLAVSSWDGVTGAWAPDWVIDLVGGTGGNQLRLPTPHTITVLRNSPEEVSIRLSTVLTSRTDPIAVDITLRRGYYYASVRMQSSYTSNFAVWSPTIAQFYAERPQLWGKFWPNASGRRRNLAYNPSLADSIVGYTTLGGTATGRSATGGSTVAVDAAYYVATASAAHAAAAFGVRHDWQTPVTATLPYTASWYVRPSVTRQLQVNIRWFDAADALISTTAGTSTSVTANTWARISASGTAPAGAVRMEVEVIGGSTTAWATGQTLGVDALLIEQTGSVQAYFDGNSENIGSTTWFAWEGRVNQSVSVRYTPHATDGGPWLGAPYEVAAIPMLSGLAMRPNESGVAQVEFWDLAIGYLPPDRSAPVDQEFRRYLGATAERVSVVAQ